MTEEPAVYVGQLRKSYGDLLAVDGVSFEIRRGEVFGIIGRNGSGKTTTVECVQGLRRADSGEVWVLGLDPRTQGVELRRRIGSQLQESALPERIRVWEALHLFADTGLDHSDWRQLLDEMLLCLSSRDDWRAALQEAKQLPGDAALQSLMSTPVRPRRLGEGEDRRESGWSSRRR